MFYRWPPCLLGLFACAFGACAFENRAASSANPDASTVDALDAAIDAAIDSPLTTTDSDGDGVPDTTDNCPATMNADQRDEDADAVGNVCDNCPHIANPNQENAQETQAGQSPDSVGDACDPLPAASGQSIVLFLPFDSPSEITNWQSAGTNAAFSVANGLLSQTGASDLAILWRNNLDYASAWITTEVTYNTLVANQRWRGVAVMTRFVRTTGFGSGVGCGEMRDTQFMGDAPFFNLMRFDNGAFNNQSHGLGATVTAGHTARYTVHHVTGTQHECSVSPSTTYTGSLGLAEGNGTGINLAVWGATVSFKYLVAIQ